jgi:hypothetical protein
LEETDGYQVRRLKVHTQGRLAAGCEARVVHCQEVNGEGNVEDQGEGEDGDQARELDQPLEGSVDP